MSERTEPYDPRAEATDDWAGDQDGLARRAVELASARTGAFPARLRRAGLAPAPVRGVSDLARIPVLSKDELPALQAADPPFGGMLAVEPGALKSIYLSPGPILDPEGDSPDFFRLAPALWAAGFRRGDVVHNSFSYHLTPAGAMFEQGLRALGCVVVPGGVGNTEAQLDLLQSTAATGYVGTPGFLLTLLERAEEGAVRLRLSRGAVSGGACPPSLRRALLERFAVHAYVSYGTADAGALAYECEAQEGWHVAPSVVVEVVDPASGEPVTAGETGEVVVTAPNEVYPLVRLGTGDLSSYLETRRCSCGRTSPRLAGFLGRVGEGVKVRGMFVHPGQLARALGRVAGVARHQAVVGERDHRDTLAVRVEPAAGALLDRAALEAALRSELRLRVEVVLVDPGAIPEGAAPIADERSLD